MNSVEDIQAIKKHYQIVGNADSLNQALDVALQVAPTDLSVLILGENGSGKEVFSHIIHDYSKRRGGKYFAVNCGAIPEGTIDSELFGHVKGSFTNAVEDHDGYFGVADGGTLFLDEVGELPLSTQARLLRVLETGEYLRVGSTEVRRTNVRIVAATNVDMMGAVKSRRFRQDLYYRLNTIPIHVPPLRDRGQDIVLLFMKFAIDMKALYHMPPIRLTPEAEQMLQAYSWPGNVRELKNLTERMSVTCNDRTITPEILSNYLPQSTGHDLVPTAAPGMDFKNERELLYGILYKMREEVNELRKRVDKLCQQNAAQHPYQLPAHHNVIETECEDMSQVDTTTQQISHVKPAPQKRKPTAHEA